MKNPWDDINLEEAKKRQKVADTLAEECKSVTPETAVDILTRINEVSDTEMAHIHADNVLCALLRNLGYNDIVNTYERINKWYS